MISRTTQVYVRYEKSDFPRYAVVFRVELWEEKQIRYEVCSLLRIFMSGLGGGRSYNGENRDFGPTSGLCWNPFRGTSNPLSHYFEKMINNLKMRHMESTG